MLDRVPTTMPLRRAVAGHLSAEQRFRRTLEDVLVGAGFSEAYTWSLVPSDPDPAALRLPDPMSGEHAVLRTTLLHGLVEAARVNVDAGNSGIRLFEIARVYLPSSEQLPDERWHVGGIAEGGFAAARAAVETVYETFHLPLEPRRTMLPHLHPGKAAETDAGWLGELHPTLLEGAWGAFELDVARLMAPLPDRILYEDVITYPAVRQDVAVVVDEDDRGRLDRRRRARGGRRRATRGPGLRRLPGRPGRREEEVRRRCTSSSRRPTGRSRTRTRTPPARGSSWRWATASARSSAHEVPPAVRNPISSPLRRRGHEARLQHRDGGARGARGRLHRGRGRDEARRLPLAPASPSSCATRRGSRSRTSSQAPSRSRSRTAPRSTISTSRGPASRSRPGSTRPATPPSP